MNYWLVRTDWKTHGGGNQFERFIHDNIWENGYSDKFLTSVNAINVGDVLCIADKSDVLGYAKCKKNLKDGKKVLVDNWLFFEESIKFSGKGAYSKTIARIADKDLLKLIKFKVDNGLLKKENFINEYSTDFKYLDAIKIQNYFSIKNIEITNLKDRKEIYFVGGNGEGKTVLLQAIVLALKKEYSGQIIEYIRDEKEVELFVKDEFTEEYSDNKNIQNVFAYGINRNKVREKFDEYGYAGLFDTSDFKDTTFLKKPLDLLKNDSTLVQEFIEKLNNDILINDLKVEKDESGKVSFIEKHNEKEFKIDFEILSEGYKSTIIWICDLTARLIENQKNIKKLVEFKAIVLVDEVDLYLHPKWKYDFVYNLRKVFPKIQFIMITHSTATILGASKDAIFYKIYKENGETKVSQPISSIKNLMANNLSTSPLFDMITARARNSDEKLKTDEDYIYTKIHEIVSEQVKGKKAIIEDEIVELINKELDDYIKEQGL